MKQNLIEKWKVEYEGFDADKEKAIYSVMREEKINKKQAKLVGDNYYKYNEWCEYVRKKYLEWNDEKLTEFVAFLQYRALKRKVLGTNLGIIFSAVFSGFFSALLGMLTGDKFIEILDEGLTNCSVLLFAVLIIILFVVYVYGVMKYMSKVLTEEQINENFYLEYKKIIDQILVEKKKKEKGSIMERKENDKERGLTQETVEMRFSVVTVGVKEGVSQETMDIVLEALNKQGKI